MKIAIIGTRGRKILSLYASDDLYGSEYVSLNLIKGLDKTYPKPEIHGETISDEYQKS
jgi:hypothetical protein